MKIIPYLYLITSLMFISSCNSAEETTAEETTALGKFTTIINNDTLKSNDAQVLIKTGFSKAITGYMGTNVLSISYVGSLSIDNTNDSYRIVAGIYYENNYKDSWVCFCRNINLVITKISNNRVWGFVEEFEATGDLGTVTISGTEFEGIPISIIEVPDLPEIIE